MTGETVRKLKTLAKDPSTTKHEREAAQRALENQDSKMDFEADWKLFEKNLTVPSGLSSAMVAFVKGLPAWETSPCPHEAIASRLPNYMGRSWCDSYILDEFTIDGSRSPTCISVQLPCTEEEAKHWGYHTNSPLWFESKPGLINIWRWNWSKSVFRLVSEGWRPGPWWSRLSKAMDKVDAIRLAEEEERKARVRQEREQAENVAGSMFQRYLQNE